MTPMERENARLKAIVASYARRMAAMARSQIVIDASSVMGEVRVLEQLINPTTGGPISEAHA